MADRDGGDWRSTWGSSPDPSKEQLMYRDTTSLSEQPTISALLAKAEAVKTGIPDSVPTTGTSTA